MVPSLCAKSLSHFSKHTGVEHRRMTPLRPQANGEVERQNHSLLKSQGRLLI